MKKAIYLLVALVATATSFAQTATWKADVLHSSLNFSVKHLGISFVDGKFDQYDGTFNGNSEEISKGSFDFTVQVNSINTGVEARDNHLKTADFFSVDQFATLTFKSHGIKKVKGNNYQLDGILTIRGISKPVRFELVYGGNVKDDGNGNEKLGFQARTTINRFDFDVSYDPTGQGISKDVSLVVNLEMTKQK